MKIPTTRDRNSDRFYLRDIGDVGDIAMLECQLISLRHHTFRTGGFVRTTHRKGGIP